MKFAPVVPLTLKGRGDVIRIAALGDLHIGSSGVDYELLERDLNYIAATPNCYALGIGDLAQFIGHLDKRFNPGAMTEECLRNIGNLWIWQCQQVAKILDPIKGKLLAAVPGNHEFKAGNGNTDVHKQIWSELGKDMRYCLTDIGSVRLRINRSGCGSTFNVDFLCHHGRGAARTEGAKKNVLVDLMNSFPAWDVYFTGHSHTRDQYEPEEVMPNQDHTDLKMRRRVGIRTGTYEKAYELGHSSYPERMAMRPQSLGCLGVQIRLVCGRDGLHEHIDLRTWDIAAEPNIADYWPSAVAKREKKAGKK